MKRTLQVYLLFLALLFCVAAIFSCKQSPAPPAEETPEKTLGVIAENGMVVSAQRQASEAGIEVLKNGGNAIDAAVAVHFCLAAIYPNAGNIGGGGFMIYRDKNGEVYTLDFREMAPAAAFRDMYLDDTGGFDDSLAMHTHLSVGVPGSVDGIITAHERFGSLPFADLMNPAIKLAEEGWEITENQTKVLNRFKKELRKRNEPDMPFARAEGHWHAGDLIKQPALAETFKRIQQNGRDGFYQGETADLLVAEMADGAGMITHEDLLNYKSVWREPIKDSYKEYTINSMAPPSSGGIALMQLLNIVEEYPIASYDYLSPDRIHLYTEAERRVFKERALTLGDPDYVELDLSALLNPEFILSKFADYNPEQASISNIEDLVPVPAESDQTTHYSIIDKEGNAVSITTTLNGHFGSKIMVDGGGFFLNNEMDDFSAKPGAYNQYGLLGNEKNAIEPGKRMLSSMTPTIVEKNGKLYMVLGSPGGSKIITAVFQTFLNVVEYDMGMQEAVNQPRFHAQWLPDSLYFEDNYSNPDLEKALSSMGHAIRFRPKMCAVDAILVREDGTLEGGADPRMDDFTAGY